MVKYKMFKKFAIIRPVAALVTGVCGGLLVNRLVPEDNNAISSESSCSVETGNKMWRVLKYAYYSMIEDIGGRLVIGLLVAALIQVAIPDEFFLHFGSQPLLQMLAILIVAVPMYICSTGSIPVAAALILLLATSILGIMPYMLAFAAGAMLYVVVEELVPDYSQGKHSNIGTIGFALGFALMMVLDVVLG